MPAQSSDVENDKPLQTATNAGDDLTQVSSQSTRELASMDELQQNRIGGHQGDAVMAPVAAGK